MEYCIFSMQMIKYSQDNNQFKNKKNLVVTCKFRNVKEIKNLKEIKNVKIIDNVPQIEYCLSTN